MERLQKVISNSGYTSRRKAEELIKEGKVLVNGEKVELGYQVKNDDIITIDGKVIETNKSDKVYFLLNKPRGVLSTVSDDLNRKTVREIIDTDKRIYPVGRLDYDTTGAILLTNDGKLTNILTHPKNEVEKVYLAKIKGKLLLEDLHKLEKGVKIDEFITHPAKVKIRNFDIKTNTSMIQIIVHEGHNHQVKKMFSTLGYDVIKLSRIRYAFLDVKSLKSGEYRILSIKEVKRLYSLERK